MVNQACITHKTAPKIENRFASKPPSGLAAINTQKDSMGSSKLAYRLTVHLIEKVFDSDNVAKVVEWKRLDKHLIFDRNILTNLIFSLYYCYH